MTTIREYVVSVLSDLREAQNVEESFQAIAGVVDFDIATVVSEEGGASVKVGVYGLSGKAAGGLSNEVTSRVRFSVRTNGAHGSIK